MTVADFVSMLATGAASVLPWVGAGVGSGVILMFVFLGIIRGFQFFNELAGNGGGKRYRFNDDWDHE